MSNVTLICKSVPESWTKCPSSEALVAYIARVSNPANQNNRETATRLVKYLIKHEHWSPFEMVSLTLEINTTRDIARQILRHRSFSFQEFSQRYATAELAHSVTREARMQDTKNRQNSTPCTDDDIRYQWYVKQCNVMDEARRTYEWALENGIAKEQARVVLPEGTTSSRLFMAGTLRSWIHYCQLRMKNGTQKEHAEIAKQCWEVITEQFPQIALAYEQSS
jgi:thymidylate synthase (FAD)